MSSEDMHGGDDMRGQILPRNATQGYAPQLQMEALRTPAPDTRVASSMQPVLVQVQVQVGLVSV
jgi:hypothetical protein